MVRPDKIDDVSRAATRAGTGALRVRTGER
jgi:hypothetical protein